MTQLYSHNPYSRSDEADDGYSSRQRDSRQTSAYNRSARQASAPVSAGQRPQVRTTQGRTTQARPSGGYGQAAGTVSAYGAGRPSRAGAGGRGSGGGGRGTAMAPVPVPLVIVALVLALVLGALLGTFVLSGLRGPQPQSSIPATIAADALDDRVGAFTYEGKVYLVSARQAIESTVSLSSRANDDGTYDAPTADMVMAYARNQILSSEVEKRGITVTEDELSDYMMQYAGTTDVAAVAQKLSMDEDQARSLMIQAAQVRKLRDTVVGASSSTSAPVAPAAPADGNTEVTNSYYAEYIIGLLGTNWDAAQGTWANTDNDYYAVLATAAFSPTSSNYEAAELAYAVAYKAWLAQTGNDGTVWTDFVNTLMDQAAITIDTLRA